MTAQAPVGLGRRTEHHDSWVQSFADHLKHDASALFAGGAQAAQQGGHNALAGVETALLDMKSGVTKFGGHLLHKDVSGVLAADDKHRRSVAATADTNSLAFKAGNIGTHVVVDTVATLAVAAGGEFVLGAAGLGTAATAGAASLGLGEAATGVAGRLAVGVAANAAGSGAVTGLQGGHVKDVLKAAAVGGLSVGVGHAVGEVMAPLSRLGAHAAPGVAEAGVEGADKVAPAVQGAARVGAKAWATRVGTEAVSGGVTGGIVSAATGDKPHDIMQNALFGAALSGAGSAIRVKGPGLHEVGAQGHVETTKGAPADPRSHEQPSGAGAEPNNKLSPRPGGDLLATTTNDAQGGHAEAGMSETTQASHDPHASGDQAAGSAPASASPQDGADLPRIAISTGRRPVLGASELAALVAQRKRSGVGAKQGASALDDLARRGERIPTPATDYASINFLHNPDPGKPHEFHNHDGIGSGTYDRRAKNANLDRMVELSKGGTHLSVNFLVHPTIFKGSQPNFKVGTPEYYQYQQLTKNGPVNMMGKIKVRGDVVTIVGPGLTDTMGEPMLQAGEYPNP